MRGTADLLGYSLTLCWWKPPEWYKMSPAGQKKHRESGNNAGAANICNRGCAQRRGRGGDFVFRSISQAFHLKHKMFLWRSGFRTTDHVWWTAKTQASPDKTQQEHTALKRMGHACVTHKSWRELIPLWSYWTEKVTVLWNWTLYCTDLRSNMAVNTEEYSC